MASIGVRVFCWESQSHRESLILAIDFPCHHLIEPLTGIHWQKESKYWYNCIYLQTSSKKRWEKKKEIKNQWRHFRFHFLLAFFFDWLLLGFVSVWLAFWFVSWIFGFAVVVVVVVDIIITVAEIEAAAIGFVLHFISGPGCAVSAGATFTQREEPQPPDDTSHRSSNKRRLYITLKNGLREFPRIPRHDRFPESETHGKASPGVAALTLSLSLSGHPPPHLPPPPPPLPSTPRAWFENRREAFTVSGCWANGQNQFAAENGTRVHHN